MSDPILQMRNIGKRFPGVKALDAVNIEVYPGEVVALAGENGAGRVQKHQGVLGGADLGPGHCIVVLLLCREDNWS